MTMIAIANTKAAHAHNHNKFEKESVPKAPPALGVGGSPSRNALERVYLRTYDVLW